MNAQAGAGSLGKSTGVGGSELAYTYLASAFGGLLVIANIIAVKPIVIGPFVVPAAVLSYALTFPITDVVSEIWGKQRARHLVWSGFAVSVAVAVLVRLAIWYPPAPVWPDQEAYAAILGANLRLVVASMAAYLLSQLHDVWAFHWWRQLTKGRHLWLRENASTLVSQFLDTAVFISLAFYGVWGGWDVIWAAIWGQYVVKAIIAVLDTPLVYLAVRLIRKPS